MKRRQFSKELKAKVAVEAIKGQRTVNELAQEYDVHVSQINLWKCNTYWLNFSVWIAILPKSLFSTFTSIGLSSHFPSQKSFYLLRAVSFLIIRYKAYFKNSVSEFLFQGNSKKPKKDMQHGVHAVKSLVYKQTLYRSRTSSEGWGIRVCR